jgi:predicted SprT family Zn-dependent metalloprotease
VALPDDAYTQLYGKAPDRRLLLKYHGNLKGYNASVRKSPTAIIFTLSRRFERCEPEIQLGVMQFLLNRLNKTKVRTDEIDMYHSFLKKMSELAPVTERDPELEQSFSRCNERFFNGMMTRPNLVWGGRNAQLLGTYTYASDTIMLSDILRDADDDTLDYVMYHEMLHKRHKFSHTGNRTRSHTKAFRDDERKFTRADRKDPEAMLKRHLYGARRRHRAAKDDRNFVERLLEWF